VQRVLGSGTRLLREVVTDVDVGVYSTFLAAHGELVAFSTRSGVQRRQEALGVFCGVFMLTAALWRRKLLAFASWRRDTGQEGSVAVAIYRVEA